MRTLCLFMVAVLTVAAQEPAQSLTFSGGTSLVRVDVQVLEGGKPVDGLTQSDFVIHDEGVAQAIRFFGREAVPVQVVMVFDISGSMGKVLAGMGQAARQALAKLGPDDEVALFVYSRDSRLLMELSKDRPMAERTLREAPLEKSLGGGTSTYDAILDVTGYFRRVPGFDGRRAVVVLTDGGGLSDRVPHEMVLQALSETSAVLNAIVPKGAKPPEPPPPGVSVNPNYSPHDVFLLARETGGDVMFTDKSGERFAEMLERIRARYGMAYAAPQAPQGSYRRLTVELSPEARRKHPKAEVHTRAGYFVPEI